MPEHIRAVLCPYVSSTLRRVCSVGGRIEQEYQVFGHHIAGVDFVPFVIETSACVWGEQAVILTKEIGRRIAEVTHEPRSTSFLRQRLSVAVQRGNAFCILGTLRSVDDDS